MPYTAADCERARRDFPSLARTVAGRPIAFLDGPAGTQVPEALRQRKRRNGTAG